MKSLNIAVVGYGLVGKKHCEIISQQNNTNLIGVVENNKDQTKNFSKFEVFTSIKEIISEIWMFIGVLIIALVIMILFPELILWLPDMFGYKG